MDNNYEGNLRFARSLIKLGIERSENPCVACSFGKGSEVVLHLSLQEKSDILVMFCNTGVEWKETLEFRDRIIKEWNLNYVETKPYKKGFWQCIKDYGVPSIKSTSGRAFPKCCYYLKEKPAEILFRGLDIDCLFLGMQSCESRNRKMILEFSKFGRAGKAARPMGAFYWKAKKQWRVNPIAFWSDEDVWRYIRENKLPYNRRYDINLELLGDMDRVGCMPCTSYIGWKRHLARTNPKMLKILLRKQGQSQLPEECTGAA